MRAWGKRLGKLQRLVEEQKKAIEHLKAENKRLACRVRDLEAQLKRNSQNSSQPPSSRPIGQNRR